MSSAHLYSPETADPSDERGGGPRDPDPDPLLHDELVRIVVLLGARFNASYDCSDLEFGVSSHSTDLGHFPNAEYF